MHRKLVLLSVVGLLLSGSIAVAEEAAAPKSDFEQFLQDAKQPVEWLKLGADARLREIFAPNLISLDSSGNGDWHFQRFRFRTWATATPVENLDFNVRLVYEPRNWCEPESKDNDDNNEALFDHLNVAWSEAFGLPLKLIVGRQDIIKGNGWLILDGTPLDGSRTIHFDAVRGIIDFEDYNTELDLAWICQKADTDHYIEPFCDKDQLVRDQNELGVMAYVTNKSLPNTQIDGFFFYKRDENPSGTHPLAVDGEIYTMGGRVAGAIGECWKYRAEAAGQWGDRFNQERCAGGFNSEVSYHLNDKWDNSFNAGYEYLSGDDPDTSGDYEGFDPLWARWPQWSELYIYTIVNENRIAEMNNLHRINVGWSFKPHEKLEVCTNYHALFTDENTMKGTAGFSDDGCFRGNLLTGLLRYRINPHIHGHLIAELFFPGDYYTDEMNDVAGFFRYEITFTW